MSEFGIVIGIVVAVLIVVVIAGLWLVDAGHTLRLDLEILDIDHLHDVIDRQSEDQR